VARFFLAHSLYIMWAQLVPSEKHRVGVVTVYAILLSPEAPF